MGDQSHCRQVGEVTLTCIYLLQSFPHLLVGFVPRTHGYENGKYFYRKKPVKHGELYSLVLTVAMFMNYKYLSMYSSGSPREILRFVDQFQNGEDLSMVAVVSNYLREVDKSQCSCIWVKEGMKEIRRKKCKHNHYCVDRERVRVVSNMPNLFCHRKQ